MFYSTDPSPNVESVFSAMGRSRFVFHQTGSRALGIESHTSDYDFFVTEDSEVVEHLKEWGFRPISSENYPEEDNVQELVGIYRHKKLPIDVQVVKCAARRQIIQDAIAPILVSNRHSTKDVITSIWQAGYLAHNATKDKNGNSSPSEMHEYAHWV